MKNKKKRFSLKRKLMTMSMVTSVIAVMLTCSLFIVYGTYLARGALEKELYLISRIMGNRVAPSIEMGVQASRQAALATFVVVLSTVL